MKKMEDNTTHNDGVVRSGRLAYLVRTGGGKPERFLCLSRTFSVGPEPRFAEARLCSSTDLAAPIVVRGRPFTNRSATLSDDTPMGGNVFLTIESTQSPPGQGHPLILSVGTGGDAAVVREMWRYGFPIPGAASAAGLTSNAPVQTPLFMASPDRPELSTFLVIGERGTEKRLLYYGAPFQLLSRHGYLGECSDERPARLAVNLEPRQGFGWKLLPFSTFYSSFAPNGCLVHLPNPTSLLSLTCSPRGCTAGGRRVYLTESQCEQDEKGHETGNEQPEARA